MRHLWLLVALISMLLLRAPVAVAPITVAVIDSGINAGHSHFAHTAISYYDPTTAYSAEGMTDLCLHGTAVAGLVVDQNPDVDLLIIKATTNCSGGYSAMTAGIQYAVEHGARIINISMAGELDYPPLHDAIIYARSQGVLVVVSAGNEGDDGTPHYPAWYAEATAVNAYDLAQSSVGEFVDVAAQGYRLRAPFGDSKGYVYFTGTSASAPIVAGMASYIWSRRPQLSLAEMEGVLYGSLVDLPPPGTDMYSGYGRVDERQLHEALGLHYLDVPWLVVDTAGQRQVASDGMVMLDDLPVVWR